MSWNTEKLDWYTTPDVWVHRGGRAGEWEQPFIDQGVVTLGWGIRFDLNQCQNWDHLAETFRRFNPDRSAASVAQTTRMFWDFLIGYRKGDVIVMPRRGTQDFAIGRVTGGYEYRPQENILGQHHFRTVEWLTTETHKSAFPSDIASLITPRKTVQRVTAPDSHSRVLNIVSGTQVPNTNTNTTIDTVTEPPDQTLDIEDVGRKQITRFLETNYREHDFAALVDAVLRAQGFETHLSPPGPDGGVDILAGKGTLGLDSPKVCVQVKSGNTAVDRMTLDQLIGAMQNFGAEQGLLVAWGGFKRSVLSLKANRWFNVRLWDSDDFIDALLDAYDNLDDDVRSTLPFKQVWALSSDPRL